MFTNLHFSTQLASDRQRDLLADAEQRRIAAQLGRRPWEPRHVIRAGQGFAGALRRIALRGTAVPA